MFQHQRWTIIVPVNIMLTSRSARCLAVALASLGAAGQALAAPAIRAEAWHAPVEQARPGQVADAIAWEAFAQPQLDSLLARARKNNPDMAIALARIVQARGQLGVAGAALYPQISLSAGRTARIEAGSGGLAPASGFTGALGVSYELDLFGALKAGKRSAAARFAAAGYNADVVTLLVESEVASQYVEYAALCDRIAILQKALENGRELERIIAVRVREGVATQVDLGLQSIEVRRIEADRSKLEEARGNVETALSLLVGEEAPGFQLGPASLAGFNLPRFAVAQPFELLARRPDIRAAEMRVSAADGDVSAARRAFLPSLGISAEGLASSAGTGFLTLGLSTLASLVAPIFDGGRRRGRLLTVKGEKQEAIEQYRKTILVALVETENALMAIAKAEERRQLFGAIRSDAARTAALSQRQFVEGAADARAALDGERGLLNVEEAYALSLRDKLNALISLHRAMGGPPRTRTG